MEWNRALAITSSRLFPVLAIQQLLTDRRDRRARRTSHGAVR